MVFGMTKKTLDTWGGIGSMLLGLVCIWSAQQHNRNESIWKVWVGMCVLLLLNGVAMIVHAQRTKQMMAHAGH